MLGKKLGGLGVCVSTLSECFWESWECNLVFLLRIEVVAGCFFSSQFYLLVSW